MDVVLSLTRAWTMVRFFDAKMLQMAACTECGGEFVTHAHDPVRGYVCGLCHMPARAGKTRRAAEMALSAAAESAA
jgi:flagellar transcriptional activator FlhC